MRCKKRKPPLHTDCRADHFWGDWELIRCVRVLRAIEVKVPGPAAAALLSPPLPHAPIPSAPSASLPSKYPGELLAFSLLPSCGSVRIVEL